MRLFALGLSLLLSLPALAFETLNYDCSVWKLADVSSALNAETNRRIRAVVAHQKTCDQKKLFKDLKNAIAKAWSKNLETWADHAKIDRCTVAARKSVYRDFTVFESPLGLSA